MLDHVVLRFDRNGQFLDYLGKKESGGTSFPLHTRLYSMAAPTTSSSFP